MALWHNKISARTPSGGRKHERCLIVSVTMLMNVLPNQDAAQELPRKTELSAVGDLPWGTHFYLLYDTGAELLETVAPCLVQGLAANEFCVWITELAPEIRTVT